MERWYFAVNFDDPDVQEKSDPELAFPQDEVTKFVGFLTEKFKAHPEELQEFVSWDTVNVVIEASALDYFLGIHDWLIENTCPKRIELIRNVSRDTVT